MTRVDIINAFIAARGYRRYLEIGVSRGASLAEVQCKVKIGVGPDPRSAATVFKTSDDFFSENTDTFDIVFIDGLHLCEQVLRDIQHATAVLNPGGVVIMHDCLPGSEAMGGRDVSAAQRSPWCGDVYRAAAWYFAQSEHRCYTVDTDYGVGVVDTAMPAATAPQFPYPDMRYLSFAEFMANRDRLLNVVPAHRVSELVSPGATVTAHGTSAAAASGVCVVIPLYKDRLSDGEADSLSQCLRVLSPRHDIALVCGNSFRGDTGHAEENSRVRFERFDDAYFRDIAAYSRLCVTPDFYERFAAYTHILLYQLDGYVFRDDLCDRWLKYDYVGAPWCLACPTCSPQCWIRDLVGNGGVSLRSVSKCLSVVQHTALATPHPEDVFAFTSRFNPAAASLSRPQCRESLLFSLETEARRGYGVTGTVPSFCHKLAQYDPELFAQFKDIYRVEEVHA